MTEVNSQGSYEVA